MPLNLPERIGPYRPIRHLGTGGMGTVYYATDPDSGRPLAVKVLHQGFADDPAHRARFRRETTTLRKVTGPYLVPLIDADPDAPLPWLATAYVQGNTLHQHVRESGPLRADNLLTFAAAVAHALACVHGAGVAHRDLKPTNVLLAADGPHVVDFGIAHHLDATAITATSVTTGTAGWMAPEQLTDGTTLPACDIFCWGLLVAYAAAAAHPFGAPTGINHRIISAAPSLKGVPDALLPLVRDALHKDPGERPSAAEIAERAAAVYGPTGTAVFPTMAYTRSFEQPDTGVTVPLDRMRWDVPLPAEPSADEEPATGDKLTVDEEPVGKEPMGDEQPAAGPVPPTPSVPQQASEEPAPSATTAQNARGEDVPPIPPPSQAPGQPPAAPEAAPAGRRTRRRRAVLCTVAAAAVLGGVAGAVAAGNSGTTGPARHPAAGPTAEPKRTATSQEPVAAPPSASGTPSVEASAVQEPEPEPVALFGGLRVTLAADSELEFSPPEGENADADAGFSWDTPEASATTVATSADFILHGDSDTGVRIMYSPSLTLDQIKEGQTDSGSMWSVENEDSDTVTDESVISTKDGPLTEVGGKKAMSWTFGTDVLPDYDGSRKSSHRVWWLPYSKYLVYTYGEHDKAAEAAVDALIDGVGFQATDMPRDCADAVVALDKAAASGEQTDDHGALTNCYDTAVNGADQLDPGTVHTRTEAACVALVQAYNGYGSYPAYDEAKAYKELRPWCDIPGAVSNPRLPDWAS